MKGKPKNLAASVHARLLNLSREQGTDFNRLLIRFAIERLLYRLSRSKHADRFVLKGAMLFVLWSDIPYRDTQDLDLLGFGDNSLEAIKTTFAEICVQPVEEDGLIFDADTIETETIRALDEYVGSRVTLDAHLGNAVVPLQIDIGVGDALVPPPNELPYPALLDFPAPTIKAYRAESVIAEKFQAMVSLGIRNTRMKDYLDLYVLSRKFSFEKRLLQEAIMATFERRRMALPLVLPLGLTSEFFENPTKQTQWTAFVRRLKLQAPSLPEVTQKIAAFISPVLDPASLVSSWTPAGPWS